MTDVRLQNINQKIQDFIKEWGFPSNKAPYEVLPLMLKSGKITYDEANYYYETSGPSLFDDRYNNFGVPSPDIFNSNLQNLRNLTMNDPLNIKDLKDKGLTLEKEQPYVAVSDNTRVDHTNMDVQIQVSEFVKWNKYNDFDIKNRTDKEEKYVGDIKLEDILKLHKINPEENEGKIIYERLSNLPQEIIDKLEPSSIHRLLEADGANYENVANDFEYMHGIQIRTYGEQRRVEAERKRQWGSDYRQKEVAYQILANKYDNAIALLQSYVDNQGMLSIGYWREKGGNLLKEISNLVGYEADDRPFHYCMTDIIEHLTQIRDENLEKLEQYVHKNSNDFAANFYIITGKRFESSSIRRFEYAIENNYDATQIEKLSEECFGTDIEDYVNSKINMAGTIDGVADVAVMLIGAEFMGAGVMANFGKGFAKIAAWKGGKIIVPMLAGGASLGTWTAFQGSVNAVTKKAPTTMQDLKNIGISSLESFGFGAFGGFFHQVAVTPLMKFIDKPAKQAVQSVSSELAVKGEMSMADVVKTTTKVASYDPSLIAKTAGFITEVGGFTGYEIIEETIKDLCTNGGNLPEDMTLEDITKYICEKFKDQALNIGQIKGISLMIMGMKGGRIGQQALINATLENAKELKDIKVKPVTVDGKQLYEIKTPKNERMLVETQDDIIKASQYLLQLQMVKNVQSELNSPNKEVKTKFNPEVKPETEIKAEIKPLDVKPVEVKPEIKINSNKVEFTNLSESDIALLQKYGISLDGAEKPQRKFFLDKQKTAKDKIDNPSSLTSELKRHHYRQHGELKELFDKNPDLDRTVGSVPRSWGKVLQSADGAKKVDAAFSKFVSSIHSGTLSSEAITVLEGELGSLLNTEVKVDRLDGGGFGVAYKIEADGRQFVLKMFRHNEQHKSSTHGGWAELSSAVYASDKTKNVAKFYMGKFGETDMDTYMLTRYISDQDADIQGIQKGNSSFNDKVQGFKMVDVISKFDIADNRGSNYKGWKIVDYGEMYETTYGKMSQEGYKVLRQMCEAADTKSQSRMQKIAEQYKGSPELKEAVEAYNFAIMRAHFVETSDVQTLRENIKMMECLGDDYKKPDFNYLAFYDHKSLSLFYEMSEAEARRIRDIFNNQNYEIEGIGGALEFEIDEAPKTTKTRPSVEVKQTAVKPEIKTTPEVKADVVEETKFYDLSDKEIRDYYRQEIPNLTDAELNCLVEQMHRVKNGEPRWLGTKDEIEMLYSISRKAAKVAYEIKRTEDIASVSEKAKIPARDKTPTPDQVRRLQEYKDHQLQESMDAVFEEIGTTLEEDTYLYRGICTRPNVHFVEVDFDKQVDFLNTIKDGGIIDNTKIGYVSTSSDPKRIYNIGVTFGQNYTLKIKVPKGTKVMDMGYYRSSDNEIVLPKNTKFKINKIDYKTGFVECELITEQPKVEVKPEIKTKSDLKVERNSAEGYNFGSVSISDEAGNTLGNVNYNLVETNGQKSLHFEGLVSNEQGKGIGTKLINELVEISKEMGAEGRLTATASPMRAQNGKMTNLEFYYKLGFRAVDENVDAQIKECIKEGKEVPLSLNIFTEIEYDPKKLDKVQDVKSEVKIDNETIKMQQESADFSPTITDKVSEYDLAYALGVVDGNPAFKPEVLTERGIKILDSQYKDSDLRFNVYEKDGKIIMAVPGFKSPKTHGLKATINDARQGATIFYKTKHSRSSFFSDEHSDVFAKLATFGFGSDKQLKELETEYLKWKDIAKKENKKFIMCGHSMGGALTRFVADQHPDDVTTRFVSFNAVGTGGIKEMRKIENYCIEGDGISNNGKVFYEQEGTKILQSNAKMKHQLSAFLEIKSEKEVTKNAKELETNYKPYEPKLLTTQSQNAFVKFDKYNSTLKPEVEQELRNIAKNIHHDAEIAEKGIAEMMERHGLTPEGYEIGHRAKSEQSIYDKLKNYLIENYEKNGTVTIQDAIKNVQDAVGVRTIIKPQDYTTNPDVQALLKAGKRKEAVELATKLQTAEMYKSLETLITSLKADGVKDFGVIRISNYVSENGVPYLSQEALDNLKKLADIGYADKNDPAYKQMLEESGLEAPEKDYSVKTKPSGYTAFQANFKTDKGFVFEWQCRGQEINDFAEAEHIQYDVFSGKDVIKGDKDYERILKPTVDLMNPNTVSPETVEYLNKYKSEYYEYLREKELGFKDAKKPKFDFEHYDVQLCADNLIKMHETLDKIDKIKKDDAKTATQKEAEINLEISNYQSWLNNFKKEVTMR